MNTSPSEGREAALRLLGIADEGTLELIKRTVADPSQTASRLLECLPGQLLAMSHALERADYGAAINRGLPVPVAPEIIELAHQIYEHEIGSVTSHPAYSHAKELLKNAMRKRFESTTRGGKGIDGASPIQTIDSVGCAAFLMGETPPFLPMLKVEVFSDQNETIWSEMLHWFDILFLSKALLQGVADHATKAQSMVANGQIAQAVPGSLNETFAELRIHIDSIERVLNPKSPETKG